MIDLFLTVMNISINASWIILAVLVIRFLFKKIPKAFTSLLWLFIGFKLICDYTFESIYALFPKHTIFPLDVTIVKNTSLQSGGSIIHEPINTGMVDSTVSMIEPLSVSFMDTLLEIVSIIWIIGVIVLIVYNIVSYFSLKHKVAASINFMDNIYYCDDIDSTFILGYIKPKIYIPSSLEKMHLTHILLHEQEHLRCFDHIKKLVGMLILSIHWFNPLVWLSYVLFCKDMEIACDERVTCTMEEEKRKRYCETLVCMSVPSKVLFACPLAFAEVGVKSRVKSILNYKKPAFWVISVSILLCCVVGIVSLTSPMNKTITTIEDRVRGDYSQFFKEVESIHVSNDTYSYTTVFKEDINKIVDVLNTMTIGSRPVSENVSLNRDMTNRIVLDNDRFIYFDADFKTVWIKDTITSSYTYKMKDPNIVKFIFEPLTVEASKDGKGPSYIDGLIEEISDHKISGKYELTISSSDVANKSYIIRMDLTDEERRKLTSNQLIRITYDGFITKVSPQVITDVTGIHIMNKTVVKSNVDELMSEGKEKVVTAMNLLIHNLKAELEDNLYRRKDLYTINQYSYLYVYYDEAESKELCKKHGYDEKTFAIITKYYGSNILEPTKEEGYGYNFYTYENINGVDQLKERSAGGVIYD